MLKVKMSQITLAPTYSRIAGKVFIQSYIQNDGKHSKDDTAEDNVSSGMLTVPPVYWCLTHVRV